MSAYCTNRDLAVEDVIDADPVASALRTLMAEQTMWTGTATDLLGALAAAVDERVAKSKTWPNGPKALSGQLRRAATFLRKIGIDISFEREGQARTRIIRITATANLSAPENGAAQPSAPSASSANPQTINPANGFAFDEMRTVGDPADGRHSDPIPTVRTKPLELNGMTDADGADANYSAQSMAEKTVWRGRL
jgi:hypothetical protein